MHPTHLTTVMEAIDCYVAADELAQGFELKVCESQGHLCEIVLSGVPRVRASTCLNIARNVALRCSRVRAGGGDVRLTVDARAVVDVPQRSTRRATPRMGWLRRVRRLFGSRACVARGAE